MRWLGPGGVLLCVFPDRRARLADAWRGWAVAGGAPVSRFSRRLGGAMAAHPAQLAGALLLLAAPTLLVFGLRGPAIFDFGDAERMTERQIAILLEGEQLVPPPPLPPLPRLPRQRRCRLRRLRRRCTAICGSG